jgi:hypothetical protein
MLPRLVFAQMTERSLRQQVNTSNFAGETVSLNQCRNVHARTLMIGGSHVRLSAAKKSSGSPASELCEIRKL